MLVFYVGNILVDKNTLCNDCILNRFIGFIQSLQVIWIVFVSSHVTSHKFLEDVHEDYMHFSSQINRFLCNHPDGPLKVSGRPAVSRSFNVEDVRTSEQHRRDARSSFSNFYTELDFCCTVWEVSARCPKYVATRSDATQRSRIFRVSFWLAAFC
jgi:hypothetical protein